MSWHIEAVQLPDGDAVEDLWIDSFGCLTEAAIDGAERLPGGWACPGLVDSHAHPSVKMGEVGPVAASATETLATLEQWARSGVTDVRDVGSPGGLILGLTFGPELPNVQAAGRFLAPAGQYFPELLPFDAPEEQLTGLGLAEVARGARWVKVIGDFPRVTGGMPSGAPSPTYPLSAISALVAAVHAAGARVAVHSTIGSPADLVAAGVDSIEHGTSMDEATLTLMAETGAAWTPTLSAVFGTPDADLPPDRARQRAGLRERFKTLLPLAVKLGVPVLTGSDGQGSIASEVAQLTDHGLTPTEALSAATAAAYRFLDIDRARSGVPTSLVTYDADPRSDPAVLSEPAAVIIRGQRIR